jgi:hydroxycarboxylate dehydrogenase B
MPIISADQLRAVGSDIFKAIGAEEKDAQLIADLLVEANLTNHDSHGVARIPQYVKKVEAGLINPKAQIEIEQENLVTATVNGNWGFGHKIAWEAMEIAMRKARAAGIAIVVVHRCNHIGRLGEYAQLAASEGMIGLVTTNGHGGDQVMRPWGGVGRVLPANSLAIAFPSNLPFPILLDLATSVVAGGKVRLAAIDQSPIPEGWLIDANGDPTTDPKHFITEPLGALLPFGGPAGYKAFGLAFALDILSGALSPAGCTCETPTPSGNALCLIAINVEAFRPLDNFKDEVDKFVTYVKASKPAPGFAEVIVPGERSHQKKMQRLKEGIPVSDFVWQSIMEICENLGILESLPV